MSKRNVYSHVGGLFPGRTAFDLSYDKKFTCDMAQLIPVMCDEVVPYRDWETDRKSTRLNSSHITRSRMPASA